VESRLPFLTPAIAQFVFSLPESYVVDDTALTKAIFRRAMTGSTPDEVLRRRDKIGFSTPEHKWLLALDGWVQGTLGSPQARENPILHAPAMLREWDALKRGEVGFDWRFWRWINFIRWADQQRIGV
jgi:asparagine synthase (glutamine-hydrolysing)